MTESKEVEPPKSNDESLATAVQDDNEESNEVEEGTSTAESSSKSKKKKKKSKLRKLLSSKPNAEVGLQEVQEAIQSATLEDKKELTREEKMKLEMVIRKLNKLLPGGGKQAADHKFWKTQPVLRFGYSPPHIASNCR